ncbi:hypothetical protein [Tenacibaculum finnmarkense]|uniref:hypothetical protein n=1 Tax=Tenacibaculum finnmarkense TaxID=2781243 RepID=UPI001EFAFD7A|nr:hypothetical protein [Tenacibaculum finnmarkense]MCG8747842.1 hypothetical protein [Tenacibaculum finnmarkense]MCG8760718.1 hypothetical protein [Tenacibaculum finnmarkense]
MSKDVLDKGEVIKGKGYADKEIICDSPNIKPEIYQGYYVFLIPKKTAIAFRIKALKAINKTETENNVYWVAQSYNKFESNHWLEFSSKEPERKLAEHLTFLNKGSKEFKNKEYSEKSTKGIKKNYRIAKPKKNKDNNTYGLISYTSSKLGAGIWLEGINYFPEWKSQGAFIIAVDKPQIMSFYAKKRISTKDVNSQEKNLKFIAKDIQVLENELEYGNIVDLHMKLHNVPYYDIELTITSDGEELLKEEIPLNRNGDNPALDYNVEQRYELHIKPSWIKTLNHEQGEDDQDSIKEGTLSIILIPNRAIMHAPHTKEDVKRLKKEISFKINYKGEWAIDEEEQEWVPQIAEIQEATLVTQKFEECRFEAIKIEDGTKGSPYHLLKQEKNGNLTTDKKTEILEYVAGNKNNVHEITISLAEVKTVECQEAGFDNATARGKSHKNNTFIVPDYDKEKNEGNKVSISNANTNKEKWQLFDHNRFFDTEIFEEKGTRSEETLTFKLAYPYDAYNEHTFLLKYLSFQIKPEYLPVVIQSCRYVRTPVFKVYPDAVFVYHYMYDAAQELYFQDKEVALLSMDADILDSAKEFIRDYLFEPFKTIIKLLGKDDSKKKKQLRSSIINTIDTFLNSTSPTQKIGFHMIADTEEINYTELQPYKALLYYQMFQVAILPLVIELLLIFFTGGLALGVKVVKVAKVAKNIQKLRKQWKTFSKANGITLIYPKLCVNFGMYRQQETNGNVGTVLEYTFQAKPLLGITATKPFEFKSNKGGVAVNLHIEGKITIDIVLMYNTLTNKFSLTNLAGKQAGSSGVPYREGDVVRIDSYINCKIDSKFNVDHKDSFNVLGTKIPFGIEVDAEFEVVGTIGVEHRFGYTKSDGVYLQEMYYFTGANGRYKAEVSATVGYFSGRIKTGDNKDKEGEAEWVETQLLEGFTYPMPKMSITNLMRTAATHKNKKSKEYEFKKEDYEFTAPPAPKVSIGVRNTKPNN